MRTSRGFTLIELLVVIAIIGVLSSVVLASLNTARLRGRDAAVMAGVRQLQTLMEINYNDLGTYASLQSSWDYTAADCNNSFTGTHAAAARLICISIVENGGALHTGNNVSSANSFSIMGKLPSKTDRYYCVGSSGGTSDDGNGGNGWIDNGCHGNP